jgi:plastocyanin
MLRSRLVRLAAPVVAAALVVGCGPSGQGPLSSFGGPSITIQARDLAFNPDIVTAPSGVPIRLVLDNQDQGVSHDIRVFQGDTDLGRAPAVVGPGLTSIELPALAPGRYQFACTLHPDMIGTIIVAAGSPAGPSDPADTPSTDNPTRPGDNATDAPAAS